jgi:FAD/FMN-containing dehydrogenase
MISTAPGMNVGGAIAPRETDQLRQRLAGALLEAGDAGYDEARTLWNGMIDKRPALIVQAQDELDIQRAVAFAAGHDLPLSVKAGGHNVAGHALVEGGLTIDLSAMRDVRVDPAARRARVQGGAHWRDFDAATAPYGLATTGGVISSTGVAGLTLGGGIGWLVGKHGMSIDNLLSATVVTAAGDIVTASETSHPDLFWALRGGGGNFGVVTSFEFALHPVAEVLAGYIVYPIEEAREVLARYREFTETAPDDLGCYAQLSTDPESGARVAALAFCWPGDPEEGRRLLAPLRAFGTPLAEVMEVMPYVDWQQAFDEEFPHGRSYYWKGALLEQIEDAAIDGLIEHAAETPLPWCTMAIEWYRGAMNRVPADATAFANRAAHYQMVAIGGWDKPGEEARGIEWTRTVHQAVAPWSLSGAFLNFNSGGDEDKRALARRGFGQNWDRLVAIKQRYDPTNLFRRNNNIPPE